MACIVEQQVTVFNNQKPQRQLNPAASIKKLLKSVRKIFKKHTQTTSISSKPSAVLLVHCCMTEEEHQNWLNEQLA